MKRRVHLASLVVMATLAFAAQSVLAQTTDLIFSEYIEGSSYNKAIEIYNGTGAQVDLSSYSVKLFNNGHTTADATLSLTGMLDDGAVYVIANSQADAAILNVADINSGVAGFNGDDALTLLHGSNVIDSLGQVGTDPGSQWGSGSVTTKDHTLRRQAGICTGDSNSGDAFDPVTEWAGYAKDTFDGLGSHTANCGAGSVILSVADVSQVEGNSGTSTFTFTVSLSSPAPAGGVSFDITTADDTATTADNDYVAKSVTGASIAEGNSSYQFDVTVNGDTTPESNETFSVTVTNASGTTNNGASATGTIENDDVLDAEIFDIQGTGDVSLLVSKRVHTHNNIVTAVGPAGFYMQTPDGRDDHIILTSNGVYVYTGGTPTVTAGDDVSLDADVDEFYGLTELKNISNLAINSNGNPLPTAIVLDAALPSPDPGSLSCGTTNFECMEGMRVSIANGIVTRANQYHSDDAYSEVFISTSGKRSLREPGLNVGLAETPGDNDAAGVWDGNPEIFEMDADAFLPPPLPNGAINGGSTFDGTGVISYGFGDYQFLPTSLNLTYNAPMPRPVADASQPDILRIGDFNVERFCDDVDDVAGGSQTYECGGNSLPSTADYQLKTARLSDYIGNVLKLPDVVALEEVENIDVLQALASKIDTDFSVTYTPQLIEGHDPSGIDVGYLVNTARAQINSVMQLGESETWTDPKSGPGAFIHDHPPLLFKGVFKGDGSLNEPFMLIAVHMKSRSKVDDDGPDSDRDREKRLRQAYSLAQQVQQLQADPGNADIPITVLGDFNDYEFSDGFVDITGMVSGRYDFAANLWDLSDISQPDQNVVSPKLWNAVYSLPDNERYSYLYTENFGNVQGFSPRKLPTNQVLDHALLSDVARAGFISMEYGRADQDAADQDEKDSTGAIGVSDHDGFVLQFTTDRIFANGFENTD